MIDIGYVPAQARSACLAIILLNDFQAGITNRIG